MRSAIVAGLSLWMFGIAGGAPAQDADKKDFSKWSEKEAQKVLSNSAWSKRMTLTEQVTDTYRGDPNARAAMGSPKETVDGPRGYGMARDSGVAGDKELYHAYVARLYSALPVRQAYVRLLQIKNGYDRMSAEQKRSFDEKNAAILNADMSDKIVVTVEFTSNDRNLNIEVAQRLRQLTKDLLQQSAFLITDRVGRVALVDYIPSTGDDLGVKLVFPRARNGEPVVRPGDREIKLEFFVPGTEHKLYIVWKTKDLTRNGAQLY